MKKLIYISIAVLIIVILVISGSILSAKNPVPVEKNNSVQEKVMQDIKTGTGKNDKKSENLKCTTCHEGDYPTKNDPLLRACPREHMIRDFKYMDKGPDEVVIDYMKENYEGVVFSHKLHSEMSAISTGCTGCHHYNTAAPILNCSECHDKNRKREDVSVPDLKAAFHRQCMTCHKQWSGDNGCNNQCHVRKGEKQIERKTSKGSSHPQLKEPGKLVYETNYDAGKIVTFFHDEHNKLFRIDCSSCHKKDNCVKCHDKTKQQGTDGKLKVQKSLDEHHQPCMNCHKINNCDKCHKNSEMAPFNHARSTGFALKSYHSSLTCTRCHGNQMPVKKLDRNCNSCHKNFTTGFNHGVTGLTLSEVHKDMDCESCHAGKDFSKPPVCSSCHDDKSYPSNSPGNKGRK